MTDGQARAICKALAYLITELTESPKTSIKKQQRKEILQYLDNAGRPSAGGTGVRQRQSVEIDGAESPGGGPAPSSRSSNAEPEELRLSVVMPDDGAPVPSVREGTIFGTPKRGPRDEKEDA